MAGNGIIGGPKRKKEEKRRERERERERESVNYHGIGSPVRAFIFPRREAALPFARIASLQLIKYAEITAYVP